jgi:hypothetical protein
MLLQAARELYWRPTVQIVDASFVGLLGANTASKAYAFLVALQVTMFFSASFLLANVFEFSLRKAAVFATAFMLGFFEQYCFDTNAWAQLAALPLYLLIITMVTLVYDPAWVSNWQPSHLLRLTLLFAIATASAWYMYPEAIPVYGTAGAVAAALGMGARRSRQNLGPSIAVLGLGLALALLLCLPYWKGTIAFCFVQMHNGVSLKNDWWTLTHRYLLGREENYLFALGLKNPGIGPFFSFPVEAGIAAVGLYWLLPTAAWPAAFPTIWKVLLYFLLAALITAAARSVGRCWRQKLGDNCSRLFAAACAGCLVPIVLLTHGNYWAAGKAWSIVTPLIFFVLISPLLEGGTSFRWCVPAMVLVFGHFALGVIRSVDAGDASGMQYTGLPDDSAPYRRWLKTSFAWDRVEHDLSLLQNCRAVSIDVGDPTVDRFIQFYLTDSHLAWSSTLPIMEDGRVLGLQRQVQRPDGLITTRYDNVKPGQTVVWLSHDCRLLDFYEGASDQIEIGVAEQPGIVTQGAYPVETTQRGFLRWTNGSAQFDVPNNPDAPAAKLTLALWDTPPETTVRVSVNGRQLLQPKMATQAITIPLSEFSCARSLAIRIDSDPPMHSSPGDSRRLGVPIRELQLSR